MVRAALFVCYVHHFTCAYVFELYLFITDFFTDTHPRLELIKKRVHNVSLYKYTGESSTECEEQFCFFFNRNTCLVIPHITERLGKEDRLFLSKWKVMLMIASFMKKSMFVLMKSLIIFIFWR